MISSSAATTSVAIVTHLLEQYLSRLGLALRTHTLEAELVFGLRGYSTAATSLVLGDYLSDK